MSATPKLGHGPVTMRRVADYKSIVKIGDFCWDVNKAGQRSLVIGLPWGTGVHPIAWSINFKNSSNAQWSWDGNEDKPTLKPSLHWVGAWHGWCKAGVLTEA